MRNEYLDTIMKRERLARYWERLFWVSLLVVETILLVKEVVL